MKKKTKRRVLIALVLLTFIISSEQESLQKASTLAVSAEPNLRAVSDNDGSDGRGMIDAPEPDASNSDGENQDTDTPDAQEGNPGQGEGQSVDGGEQGDGTGIADGQGEAAEDGTDGVGIADPDSDDADAPMQENLTEEEEAEEQDGTIEQEELDYAGVQKGTASFGATVAELGAERTFYIKTYQDWLNLQALSRESSLEGYVFQINANNSVSTDYTEANHYNLSLLGSEFTGIGTESTPFLGTLKCYSSNNLTLMFGAQPLFNDLGGSASLENLKIQCTNSQSGLAKTLRGGGTLSMKNVFISGSVYNNTATANGGNAGGLFGVIDNQTDTPLTFRVQKETTTTQNGVAIGVSGNDKNNSTRLTIQGRICGTIAGTVRGNVDFVYDPATFSVAPTTTVTGKNKEGANGMIFGQMLGDASGYRPAFRLSGDATFTPRLSESGTNGGVIGRGENMLLDTRGYTLTVDGSTNGNSVDVQGNSATADGGCGGVIGWLKDSETTAETNIIVQNMSIQDSGVKNTGGIFGGTDNCVIGTNGSEDKGWQVLNAGIYGGNVGGLIGKYIAGNQDNTLKYVQSVNVLVQRNTDYTGQGGIIGYVKFDSDHSLSVDEWTVQGLYANSGNSADGYGTGGVAGKIEGVAAGGTLIVDHGTRISVSKSGVATNFTSTTHWLYDYNGALGSILGYCTNVDAELSNLYINGSYMQSYAYNGTLIGRIDNNSAVKHVYVKDITFERSTAEWTNYVKFNVGNANTISGFLFGLVGKNTIVKLDGSIDSSRVTWNYSTNRYLGKAVGVQEQALIYVEKDADYVPRSGVIDEIGNFGGIYRNGSWDGDGKLLIENDTLSGTVAKNGDGKYVLDSVGDLLRLSIALNTEGAFGTSCFGEDYAALLAGHYYVAGGEYDLTQTGMVSMQRNVGAGTDRTATPARFTGSFEGASKTNKAKITLATELYARQYQQGSPQYYGQTNQGLFINVGAPASDAPASFANLELAADLQYQSQTENRVNATNVGGIAAYAYGNVTVQDCSVTLNTRSMYHSSEYKGYYGGVFGRYDAVSGSTLTVQDVEAGGDKYVYDKDLYTSQVIGYIEYQSYAVIPQIKFENITLSGQIVASRSDSWQVIGGLVAVINNSNATGNAAYNNFYNYGTYVKRGEMEIKNVTVRGMTVTDNTSTYKSGGLLGFRWTDTVITMSGIRVTGDASTQNTISGSKRFGALITEVAGRLDAKDISVDHLTVNVSEPIYPGLLVGEGRAMYLTLSDYRIDHDTTKIGLSDNFDEIVGINQASEGGSEESGGIVSIDTSSYPLARHLKVGDASNAYKSYVNQATYNNGNTASNAVTNSRTRYYYDIPQILEAANNAGASLKDNTISTPEELLDWHLLNYAVSQLRPMFLLEIDKTINSNAATAASSLVGRSYTIDGTIDLNGYSYYPTTISGKTFTGANNATIIFHAQEMIEGEDAVDVSGTAVQSKRYTYNSNKQHYLMHAGLFYNVTASTIRNLTLKGTVSTMESGSGALVVGTIWGSGASAEDRQHGYTYSTTAKTTIENIDLDNLWVSGSNTTWEGNYGLMVRQIGRGSKVTFDSIRMQNYDADHPLNKKTNKKA
ncbi:MAG: hypothetical protein IJ711_07685, partial [Lachnospiraceae bacterium]|nr:hypothetical protein [Lachnospiraceae bacterium]